MLIAAHLFRETIIAYQRPYLFHYMLTEFSGAPQKGVVNEAIAMFIVQPYGPRAHVNWHYAIRPESDARLADTRAFMQNVWRPWQQGFLDTLKEGVGQRSMVCLRLRHDQDMVCYRGILRIWTHTDGETAVAR
jgi:hypothetical protein